MPNSKILPLLAFLIAPVLNAAAASAPPAPRQPTKGWVLDYAETNCTASRAYGSDVDPLELVLRPSPFGHVLQLIVLRNGRGEWAMHVPVTVTLPNAPLKTTALRYWDHKGHEILLVSFRSEALEQMRAAPTVGIHAGGIIDETFAVPVIGKVMQGLDACDADLLQHWNAEAGDTKVKVRARSLAPLASYFSDADYPAQAVSENRSGISAVTMMIDETGTMRDCLVEETSGIASLDAMACALFMKRAKFKPALDAAGKPIRSIYQDRVKWVMP
ncbi:MAG TPA: energy transducer TonB [Allosphingosinicella sp.]|nr:energy transducer TonB [Allosphingosinicella sp.]